MNNISTQQAQAGDDDPSKTNVADLPTKLMTGPQPTTLVHMIQHFLNMPKKSSHKF
jgi:hypothetical protein